MLKRSPGKLRVVLDTNIYIAAFLRPGMSEELLKQGLRGKFQLVTSQDILDELARKLRQKFAIPQEENAAFITMVKAASSIVKPTGKIKEIASDPDDNQVLECALAGKANLIISMDKHLLELRFWRGISILHPSTFRYIVQ